ncbi:hypothetical protein [Sinimarinibacterium flocculans]|uniref:hypothetical protein n=1 Tax=Sinimarinibacterium flocculans TaxID=985250 RepID=UPI0035195C61
MSHLSESLRELPAFEPPADGWSRLQQALLPAPRRRRRTTAALALAASVLAAVGIVRLMPPQALSPADPEITALMQRSQALERHLVRLRPQVVVWDARYAATTQAIESDIAMVDLQLNHASAAGARTLWENRVSLLDRLVATHQAAGEGPSAVALAPAQQEWSL